MCSRSVVCSFFPGAQKSLNHLKDASWKDIIRKVWGWVANSLMVEGCWFSMKAFSPPFPVKVNSTKTCSRFSLRGVPHKKFLLFPVWKHPKVVAHRILIEKGRSKIESSPKYVVHVKVFAVQRRHSPIVYWYHILYWTCAFVIVLGRKSPWWPI